jgi:hydrogenase maturation protease
MRTLILCLGNELVSDDGIGAEVGQVLLALPLPTDIEVMMVPRLRFGLLDRLAEVEHLIIVDGLTAEAEAGTCTLVDVTQHSGAVVASGCCHSREVCDVIRLARELAPAGAECSIMIAGVRVGQVERYGAGFSRAALLAVPRIVDLLLLTSGASLSLRLLAAESLRQREWREDDSSVPSTWRESCSQVASLQ